MRCPGNCLIQTTSDLKVQRFVPYQVHCHKWMGSRGLGKKPVKPVIVVRCITCDSWNCYVVTCMYINLAWLGSRYHYYILRVPNTYTSYIIDPRPALSLFPFVLCWADDATVSESHVSSEGFCEICEKFIPLQRSWFRHFFFFQHTHLTLESQLSARSRKEYLSNT